MTKPYENDLSDSLKPATDTRERRRLAWGDKLSVQIPKNQIGPRPVDQALAEARAIARSIVGPSAGVDAFLADRRADAMR